MDMMKQRNNWLAAIFLMSIATLCSSCETISYYSQAVSGQFSLLAARQSITKVIDAKALEATPSSTETAAKLRSVLEMRTFAETMLMLPVGKTFSSYVDLHASRDEDNYIVWNVFAAPALSVDAKSWCYLIAGCAAYRGYFSKQEAQAYALRLQEQGLDTYVAGVRAYSTLGWFADPVLSSFLGYSEAALAGLIFHELAHKVVYVGGDTEFNESFATVVEREGLRRWLALHSKPEQMLMYEKRKRLHADFVTLIEGLRERLKEVYQSAINDEQKLAEKKALFAGMQQTIVATLQQPDASRYGRWVKQLDNNAKLVPINSYNRWVPALTMLFEQSSHDFALFYAQAELLANQSDTERETNLLQLSQ